LRYFGVPAKSLDRRLGNETVTNVTRLDHSAVSRARLVVWHDCPVQVPGSVVIVTGAGHGIGRAIAGLLAERGALVIGVDRDGAALDDLSRAIDLVPVEVDLADPAHADQVVATAMSAYGRIDALIANAGIGYVGTFATMPAPDISTLLAVNTRAPMLLTRAVLPTMLEQQRGALVFTTSIAGLLPVPTEAAYSASKAALESFADAMREEVRDHGVVVSTVRPGVVHTAFHEQRNEPYERRWPRPVRPEQIARVIVQVLESGSQRRTEPRWLGIPTYVRSTLPWLYRPLARRLG
jgi:short-subunit dehydrogenase